MFPLFLTNRNSVCFSDFLVALPKTAFCLAKGCLLPGERLCPALPKVMFCVAGGKKRRFYRCFSLWRFLFCAFLLSKFLNCRLVCLFIFFCICMHRVPCFCTLMFVAAAVCLFIQCRVAGLRLSVRPAGGQCSKCLF